MCLFKSCAFGREFTSSAMASSTCEGFKCGAKFHSVSDTFCGKLECGNADCCESSATCGAHRWPAGNVKLGNAPADCTAEEFGTCSTEIGSWDSISTDDDDVDMEVLQDLAKWLSCDRQNYPPQLSACTACRLGDSRKLRPCKCQINWVPIKSWQDGDFKIEILKPVKAFKPWR